MPIARGPASIPLRSSFPPHRRRLLRRRPLLTPPSSASIRMAALQLLPGPLAPGSSARAAAAAAAAPASASSAASCCLAARSPPESARWRCCHRHPPRCSQGASSGGGIGGKFVPSAAAASSFLSASTTADATGDTAAPTLTAPSVSSGAAPPAEDVKLKNVTTDSLQYESGYLGGISAKTRPSWGMSWTSTPPSYDKPSAMDYLAHTLTSRVYDVAIESPLQLASKLSERLGVQFWLKREDLQPVSFHSPRLHLSEVQARVFVQ